jgi:hypothetical protein
MGTPWGPPVANAFLFCFEFKFLDQKLYEQYGLAPSDFANMSRYIDDILAMDNPAFESCVNLENALTLEERVEIWESRGLSA